MESVKTMSKIIKEIESEVAGKELELDNVTFTDCIINAILAIDKLLRIDAVLVITSGGYTARMLASKKLRPKIIAITTKNKVFRQMNILWGVIPLLTTANIDRITDEGKKEAIMSGVKKGLINKTDHIVISGSVFNFKTKRTNMLEMHNVNEFLEHMGKI